MSPRFAHDRRAWRSVLSRKRFNGIPIDDVRRCSLQRRATESAKQEQIHVRNIAVRRSSKCSEHDTVLDRPGCIRANISQRTNDRYDRARTAASSRIECDFDCSRKFANSHFKGIAIVVGAER